MSAPSAPCQLVAFASLPGVPLSLHEAPAWWRRRGRPGIQLGSARRLAAGTGSRPGPHPVVAGSVAGDRLDTLCYPETRMKPWSGSSRRRAAGARRAGVALLLRSPCAWGGDLRSGRSLALVTCSRPRRQCRAGLGTNLRRCGRDDAVPLNRGAAPWSLRAMLVVGVSRRRMKPNRRQC